jgi:uncharacterized protein (TIGR01777 family)
VRVAVAGGTGTIGSRVVSALLERGDEVTLLARDPQAARRRFGTEAVAWNAADGPPSPDALAGQDAVVNLAGSPLDRRWSERVKRDVRATRVDGTRNLVAGLAAAEPRPRALVNASGVGYYGPRGDEPVTETEPPGSDFLSRLAADWEAAAREAEPLGLRVVTVRSGLVLAREGGALARMLLPFKLGLGGPIGSGRQVYPWIHVEDEVGILVAALDGDDWSGPVNATAPEPVTAREFTKALGRALRRPAVLPLPSPALKLALGEMSTILLTGQRAVPERALELGYRFRHPDLDEALRSLVS